MLGNRPSVQFVVDESMVNVTNEAEQNITSGQHMMLDTAAELHAPFHYDQSTDPGAVGAGKWWHDSGPGTVKRRNDANSAWTTWLTGG